MAEVPADPAVGDTVRVPVPWSALTALAAERDRLAAQLAAAPALWSCPDCAFTFDAMHTDADGGYSCPACAETRLAAQLAAAHGLLEKLRRDLVWLNDKLAVILDAAASPSTPEETPQAQCRDCARPIRTDRESEEGMSGLCLPCLHGPLPSSPEATR